MTGYSKEVEWQLRKLGLSKIPVGRTSAHADMETAFSTLETIFNPASNSSWIAGLQRIHTEGRRSESHFDFTLQFQEGFKVPFVNIKAISNEQFMICYDGCAQVHGLTAPQVRERSLVYLNGCWAESSIIADLLAQILNLQQERGKEEETKALLMMLPANVRNMYTEGYNFVDQYRFKFFQWMNYVPPPVFYVDDGGVRPYR